MRMILLIGPPASGKGTQAQMFEDELKYTHVSTGDIFRNIMKEDTPIGKQIKYYMDRAMLVPDELSIKVLNDRIAKMQEQKVVLDGYPRTMEQALELDKNSSIDQIIHLDVSLDSIKNRIKNRRVCPKCKKIYNMLMEKTDTCKVCGTKLVKRNDDEESIVESRYKDYQDNTEPVIGYYKKKNRLITINGEGNIREVFDRLKESLGVNR